MHVPLVWRSIVKSLGISQIVHSAAVLDIHKDNIVKVQFLIFKFIWKDKQDKIKREVLYQDYERGGLRVTHVETLCKALRLAWIQRFLKGKSSHVPFLRNMGAYISCFIVTLTKIS